MGRRARNPTPCGRHGRPQNPQTVSALMSLEPPSDSVPFSIAAAIIRPSDARPRSVYRAEHKALRFIVSRTTHWATGDGICSDSRALGMCPVTAHSYVRERAYDSWTAGSATVTREAVRAVLILANRPQPPKLRRFVFTITEGGLGGNAQNLRMIRQQMSNRDRRRRPGVAFAIVEGLVAHASSLKERRKGQGLRAVALISARSRVNRVFAPPPRKPCQRSPT